MPYALCPMPYARRVPHVTEKGYKSVQGFNSIQENQPGIAASQRGPTATNAFEIGKKFSRAMLAKHCLDAGFGQFFNI